MEKRGKKHEIYRIGITGDFRTSESELGMDPAALERLRELKGVTVEPIDMDSGAVLTREMLQRYDAILMQRSPLSAEVLDASDLRCIHIARQGVGLDHLDLHACTKAGVIVTTTPESVRRPMASGAMAFILAFSHRLIEKMNLAASGRWLDRRQFRGTGLSGRTLGLVGCGNIGAEILRLSAPWEMNRLVHTPSSTSDRVRALGADAVDLQTLLRRADFVVLCCPLNDSTRHLINIETLSWMKSDAYLINIARGEVIDQSALISALKVGRLAGAALDVLDPEPPQPDSPLLGLRNVIVTAHNIGLTDEGFRLGNLSATAAMATVAEGRPPDNVANLSSLDHPRVMERLNELSAATSLC